MKIFRDSGAVVNDRDAESAAMPIDIHLDPAVLIALVSKLSKTC
jgi:hypothetical protein